MSRKGKLPIPVPKNVDVKIDQNTITVKGPKGTQSLDFLPTIDVTSNEGEIVVGLKENAQKKRNFHGLYRTLISNMVVGVTEGFKKTLEMVGVGYRANVQGNRLNLKANFSHEVGLPIPDGIQVEIEKETNIHISGANLQQVGQFAASVRAKRPPEPYKAKGIRYKNEYIRRKAGKSAAKK